MMNKSTIKELLSSGNMITTSTVGRSMEPLLYEHDTSVMVSPVNRPLKKGDMVLFAMSEREYVIHRLVGFGEGVYYTLGDNNINSETVAESQILGYVSEIYRHGKCIKSSDIAYRCYFMFWVPARRFRRRVVRKMRRILQGMKTPS